MRILPTITAAVAVAALAGCTGTSPSATIESDTQLQQLLAGKTAGPAQSCIPQRQAGTAASVATASALAFQANPGLIYVSNVQDSGCADADNPNYSLVTTSRGSDLCSGDRVEVRDLVTRGFHGSCVLSDFVPYRTR
jgi:hypothetical protein